MKLLLLFFCFLVSGCGKVGDPSLPQKAAVYNLNWIESNAVEDSIILEWKVAGEAINIDKFEIYRLSQGDKRDSSAGFQKIGVVGPGKEEAEKGRRRFEDRTGLIKGSWFHYVVASYDKDGKLNGISETADVFFSVEPEAPKNLRARREENYVSLSWESPGTNIDGTDLLDLAGFNIYRKAEGKNKFEAVNRTLIRKASYIDMDLEKDKTYYYIVRAVDNFYPPWHESTDSGMIKVDFVDFMPPPNPSNLVALGGIGRISLAWDHVAAEDILGYRVYRSQSQGKGYRPLGKGIAEDIFYDDVEVKKGVRYYYVVTSVDSSARRNESGFSNEAMAQSE